MASYLARSAFRYGGPVLKRILKSQVNKRKLKKLTGAGILAAAGAGASKYGTAGLGPQSYLGKRAADTYSGAVKRRNFGPRTAKHYSRRSKHRVADYSVSFRRGKYPVSSKYVQKHYDDYGTIQRTHSLWLCNHTHGSRDRIIQLASEALLRALLSRIDVYPSVHDQTMSEHFLELEITWRRTPIDGGNVDTIKSYNVGGNDSFYGIAKQIAQHWMDASPTTTGLGCPTKAIFRRKDAYSSTQEFKQAFRTIEDLDRMKLNLFVNTKVKVQNITPADDGSVELDRVSTNPLSGKIYEFTSQPSIPERVTSTHTGVTGLQDFSDISGIFAMTDRAETGMDGIIGHPPPAAGLFNNCRKVASIAMNAGGQKHKSATYKFTGTVFRFTQRFVLGSDTGGNSAQVRRFGGGCYWIALEQAFRQGPDIVKIGFNREVVMHGRAEFAKRRSMLRHYEQTDLGDAY